MTFDEREARQRSCNEMARRQILTMPDSDDRAKLLAAVARRDAHLDDWRRQALALRPLLPEALRRRGTSLAMRLAAAPGV